MASQSGCKCLLSQGFALFHLVPMEMSLCEHSLRGCVHLPKNSLPASVISDRGVFVSKCPTRLMKVSCGGEACIHRGEACATLASEGHKGKETLETLFMSFISSIFRVESLPFRQEGKFPNDLPTFFCIYL